ncbi:MAG: response regulator [Candidatus Buchananbacteria bacterium]|nr:response regulator [Candidatus Buchananbacteria bacterium]
MSGKSKRILVVEDEKPMAKALELKLTHAGYQVVTASNGEEALMILEKDKFDLILLDIIMPKMDGFGVLEALKKQGKKTPVIMSSNLSQPEDEKKHGSWGQKIFLLNQIPRLLILSNE